MTKHTRGDSDTHKDVQKTVDEPNKSADREKPEDRNTVAREERLIGSERFPRKGDEFDE
jgi:hypothetical protein